MRRSTLESCGGGMLTSRVPKAMFVSARPGGARQPSQDPEISSSDNTEADGHNITTPNSYIDAVPWRARSDH